MDALILAAGFGTRLGEYSQGLPKQLVPIHGKPVIEYLVRKLDQSTLIQKIYLLTNQKFYEDFQKWIQNLKPQLIKPITLINNGRQTNEERNGSVGDILFGSNKIQNAETEGLLVIQGDELVPELDIDSFLNEYFKTENMYIIGHRKSKAEIAGRFGAIEINPDTRRILSVDEKPAEPKTDLANGGHYVFSPEALKKTHEYRLFKLKNHKEITPNKPFYLDNTGKLFDWMAKEGLPMFVYEYSGIWFDVGKPEVLAAATAYFKK